MRRLLPYAVALAVVGLLVWAFVPRPLPVETGTVAHADLVVRIEAEGEARIREVIVVSAPIAGLLERVTLHPGDAVAAGQAVARMGPVAPALLDARARAVAEAGVAAAGASVELARSQLVQAEAALDYAAAESARAQALFARAALSQRLLDDAILAERTAEAAAASARANLAMRERELDSAQAYLDGGLAVSGAPCCVAVQAPIAGRVLRVLHEDEQVVQAGTPILELGDNADLEILGDVLSRDAVRIAAGADAVITGWGGPDLAARVTRIDPAATTRVSALGIEEQRVGVRLALRDPPPPELGHGFRVLARITVWQGSGVVAVPVAALFRVGGDWAVYVVEGGRAALRRVAVGQRSEEMAEVTGGLAEGDVVILHPGDAIADRTRVTPAP